MIHRMRLRDFGRFGEVAGFEEKQRGDRPRVRGHACAGRGFGVAGAGHIRRKDAWFEFMAGGVLHARPRADFLLAARLIAVGKGVWSLTKEYNKRVHVGVGLGGGGKSVGGGLCAGVDQNGTQRHQREKGDAQTRERSAAQREGAGGFHDLTLSPMHRDDL